MPTTYYLISDLHIGGDGGLSQCEFERELVEFLAEIAAGPQPAELMIVGDAFGLWELTDREGVSKLETIAAAHPALFRQLRETGARVTITLLPGNHDYDLACVPEYKAELARYNVRLEPVVHITRDDRGPDGLDRARQPVRRLQSLPRLRQPLWPTARLLHHAWRGRLGGAERRADEDQVARRRAVRVPE